MRRRWWAHFVGRKIAARSSHDNDNNPEESETQAFGGGEKVTHE
jgi:hypothetical protein